MSINLSVRAVLRFTADKKANLDTNGLRGVLLSSDWAGATDRYIAGFSTHHIDGLGDSRFVLRPVDAQMIARMRGETHATVNGDTLTVTDQDGEPHRFARWEGDYPDIYRLWTGLKEPVAVENPWWNLDLLSRLDPTKMARRQIERREPFIRFQFHGDQSRGGRVSWRFYEHTFGVFQPIRNQTRKDLS